MACLEHPVAIQRQRSGPNYDVGFPHKAAPTGVIGRKWSGE